MTSNAEHNLFFSFFFFLKPTAMSLKLDISSSSFFLCAALAWDEGECVWCEGSPEKAGPQALWTCLLPYTKGHLNKLPGFSSDERGGNGFLGAAVPDTPCASWDKLNLMHTGSEILHAETVHARLISHCTHFYFCTFISVLLLIILSVYYCLIPSAAVMMLISPLRDQ